MSHFVKQIQDEVIELAEEAKVYMHQRSLNNGTSSGLSEKQVSIVEEHKCITQCIMVLISLIHVRLPHLSENEKFDIELPETLKHDLGNALNGLKTNDDAFIKRLINFSDRVLRVSRISLHKC